MANALAAKGRQGFLEGSVAWLTDTIKVVLLTSTYVYSAGHDFLDDVTAGARKATVTLGSKTSTDGYADAGDSTFTAVAGGSTITQIWVYKDTGVEATSRLIAYYDTRSDASPISVVTNGGDILVQWAALGLFRL